MGLYTGKMILQAIDDSDFELDDAYWISPEGKIRLVGKTHLQDIVDSPVEFGLNSKDIENKYLEYGKDFEVKMIGKGGLIDEVLEKGWIRIRRQIFKNSFEVEIWVLTDKLRGYICQWASAVVNKNKEFLRSTVDIVETKNGLCIYESFLISDLISGSFSSGFKFEDIIEYYLIPLSKQESFLTRIPVYRMRKKLEGLITGFSDERNLIEEFKNQLQQKGIHGEWLESAVADFVKFLKKQNDELFEEKRKKSDISSIGVFWLSGDYKKVTRIAGMKEFQDSDVMNGVLVEPGVMHRDYSKTFFKHNRGRLCVHNKVVELWVGEGCPKSTVNDIKEYFGLRENIYRVIVYRDIGYDKELDIGDRVILLSTGDSGNIEDIDYKLDKVRIKSDNGIIFESKIIDIEYADED